MAARLLFATLDVTYGKGRNLEKFRVLELVARVPYQAWEHVAYVALTHKASEPDLRDASSPRSAPVDANKTTSSGIC